MALLKFKQGLLDRLPEYSTESVGTVYITSDSQEMKVDLPDGRINVSDFIIADSVDANGILTVGEKTLNKYFDNIFYYVKGENVLRKCVATEITETVTSVVWTKIGDLTALNSAVETLAGKISTAEGKITALEAKDTELESAIAGINAGNVDTTDEIVVTKAVGNFAVGKVIDSETSLQDLILNMLCADSAPSVTNTSLKFSKGSTQYIEVGSSTTQEVTASFEDGKYPYGYALTADGSVDTTDGSDGDKAAGVENSSNGINHPGVTKSAFTINYRGGDPEASSTASDTLTVTLNSGVETSTATQSATASVTHGAGYIPVSILKNKYKSKKISSNTRTATLEAFRWYVPMYYGFKYADNFITDPTKAENINITGFETSVTGETAYNKTKPTTATALNSWRQFFVAIPTDEGFLSSTENYKPAAKDGNGIDLTVNRGPQVELTLGTATKQYQVFYIYQDAPHNTLTVNLTW